MPGGQYTNLYEQARALGLEDRWREICHVYAEVNGLFGDIVKVTPTSKAVGDMAMPGMVDTLAVEPGAAVCAGQKLLVIEAMKMFTTIAAERDAKVVDVFVKAGSPIETGDLLILME